MGLVCGLLHCAPRAGSASERTFRREKRLRTDSPHALTLVAWARNLDDTAQTALVRLLPHLRVLLPRLRRPIRIAHLESSALT